MTVASRSPTLGTAHVQPPKRTNSPSDLAGVCLSQMRSPDDRFHRIFNQHRSLLRGALRSLPRSLGPTDVDDIEQEVALRLWRALEDGREIREMGAYLRTLVRSAVLDALRKAKVRQESRHQTLSVVGADEHHSPSEPRATAPDPERDASSAELGQALQQSLQALHPSRREAVTLHIRGFANREICEELGWSEGKTRNLTSRGLADLRSQLRQRGWFHD